MNSTIITTLLSMVGTLAGVILGNRLSSRQSYKEKIWDLRRVACGVILSEFAAVERVYDAGDEYLQESNFHQYHGRGGYKEYTEEMNKHFQVIYQRMADDYLILSEEFISLYEQYSKEVGGDPCNDDVETEYQRSAKAIRKYRPLLVALARKEIANHIRRPWPLT